MTEEVKPKRKRQKPGDKHYVNNKEFYADMVRYNEVLTPAKEEYALLLKEREKAIDEGMIDIEEQYKESIETGERTISEAKMIYDEAKDVLFDQNVIESWYSWRPMVPKDVANKILLICQRLRYKPNFINYSYVDEMVLDAVENCIKYACKFNPEKSENPFSYFTTIANYAFIRRIKSEKQFLLTKAHYVQQSGITPGGDFETQDGSLGDFHNSYRDFLRNFYDMDIPETEKKERKKRKSKADNTNTLPVQE